MSVAPRPPIYLDADACPVKDETYRVAERYGLPFNLVDPDDSESLGYNPCSGDAAAVANKLVGAFTYGPAAEIYKNIAMEAIPVVVRGLFAADEEVTLQALYDAFAPRGMAKLAQRNSKRRLASLSLCVRGFHPPRQILGKPRKGPLQRLPALAYRFALHRQGLRDRTDRNRG